MIKIFEGKNPAERNKTIAALVLGTMALLAILYNIVGLYPSRKTSVTVKVSPTPTASPKTSVEVATLPNQEEVNFDYTTTPVVYNPGNFYAPDAGRNIFAFYEPPPPTPYVAPPIVIRPETPPPTPPPTPVPPIQVGYVTPQSVYAGSKTFRLEVNGDKFTPDSLIFLNGNQLPTNFINPQKLTADVPANMIAGAGSVFIIVRTPDGKLYSNQVTLNVQAPPQPSLQYIGMIARKRYNNDTAYFQEKGKETPIGARLNDVVGGRFRLASISAQEVILEDVNLGFRYPLALYRPAPGEVTPGSNPNRNNQNYENYTPYNP
ncbi:MAG: hypothetical protein M3033_15800, partial [Acidobacteriota bacterium]|nr:hypothetical protein [Acidobacteriota bacterium]